MTHACLYRRERVAGVSGFDTNMMRSFVSHARAEASLIARMEHGKAITQAMADMRREAVGPDLVRTYNLLSKHFTHTMKGTDTPDTKRRRIH